MTHAADGAALPAPALRRRLAAFVYEGVLLFGLLMTAGLIYGIATQQRHALQGLHGLQVFVFLVLGVYFSWFWTHGGQTVAMKTWHLRVLTPQGQPVRMARAWARYLLSWLWFLPALLFAYLAGLRGGTQVGMALFVGVIAYASLAFFNRQRQLPHELMSGTRLVHSPTPARGSK